MSISRLIGFGVAGALGAFSVFSPAAADTKVLQVDILGTTEIYKFVVAVALPTAQAPLARFGTQTTVDVSKYVTLGKNGQNEVVATSVGVVPVDGDLPALPPGTVAVLRVQGKSECQVPHGNDYAPLERGASSFIVSNSGANIWEIGAVRGIVSIRLVKGADQFGDWEAYRADASKYVTYTCDKYL
jgi:hypothetical protein